MRVSNAPRLPLGAWLLFAAACASPATATVDVAPPPAVPAVSEAPAAPETKPAATTAKAPTEPAKPQNAPPPFDSAAIRGATKPGRTYVFLVKDGDSPQTRRKIEFVSVSDDKATMRSSKQDLFGHAKGEPVDKVVTWDELMSHATYPADATTIRDAKVKVQAGAYDCKLYTVKETKDGKAQITKAWFATSLPGAPVKHEVSVDGKVVSSMELFQYRAGS
jgi:hypothetical protein